MSNYYVMFLRGDGTVKKVTGFPVYRGAVILASELVGGRLIAAQVRRTSDDKMLAQFLDPALEGIMADYFTFDAAMKQ